MDKHVKMQMYGWTHNENRYVYFITLKNNEQCIRKRHKTMEDMIPMDENNIMDKMNEHNNVMNLKNEAT